MPAYWGGMLDLLEEVQAHALDAEEALDRNAARLPAINGRSEAGAAIITDMEEARGQVGIALAICRQMRAQIAVANGAQPLHEATVLKRVRK